MHIQSLRQRPPHSLGNRTRAQPLSLRKIHKVTGLAIALPVLLLVFTGIPLEFVDPLKLGSRGVSYEWVHASYGVSPPDKARQIDNVVQVDDLIITPHHTIERTSPLLATQSLGDFSLVLTQSEWFLVPNDSQAPLERGQLPLRAKRAGFAAGLPVVEGVNSELLTSTDYGASWQPMQAPMYTWADVATVPMNTEWKEIYGSHIVTWERWLQDLHSGRFFGTVGQWIMSLAGFALIVLAFSGFLVWYRSLRR